MVDPDNLAREFEATFGRLPRVYRAPGRVNLIGEHTDYNDGFVMPMALDRSTWVAAAPRTDDTIVVRSREYGETVTVAGNHVGRRDWSAYVHGVASVLGVSGADMLIASDVPIGAGLSSSAALEVAVGYALLDLAGASVDFTELARACQRAEHEYTGTRCGIMDQMIACYGRAGHALMLDTRSLDRRWLRLPPAVRVLVCNTMVRHELASGEYNARRADCEAGVRLLAQTFPNVRALRDVRPAQLDAVRDRLPEQVFRRCRHVIAENTRVEQAADALERGDFETFGRLMGDSHTSLRDDYEVSCAELDTMVAILGDLKGVQGARMTGGGFGGCAIALVESDAVDRVQQTIVRRYEQSMGLRPDVWVCAAGDGAGEWTRSATTLPHRRFNPLRQEWVLVSPQRNERPWQGQVDQPQSDTAPTYEPICYLCPGNERAHGVRNPQYTSTFAFDNDFAALVPANPGLREPQAALSSSKGESQIPNPGDLLTARAERGICRVVCFSPRHDLTLGRMETRDVRAVVDKWIEEYQTLATIPWVEYALVFENRGPMMGASNPHPHGQIWATETIPNEPAREQDAFARHRSRRGTCLLCDYAGLERGRGERLVCENEAFLAVVPFWAVWPFETLLISRRHVGAMHELDDGERDALADMLRRLITRYDNLFEAPFPYSMGFHQRAIRARDEGWHLHAHVYPPLLRSATIRKFMVGFELLGSPQRDLTPEDAAARLRAVSEIHYTTRIKDGVAR